MTPKEIIDRFRLQPNEMEGGYFTGTYESALRIADANLPGFPATANGRSICSAIYYFLDQQGCSIMHKVTGDMIYHFYSGDPVEMLLLYPDGYPNRWEICIFSNNLSVGGKPMKSIPGGTWLGSRLMAGGSYALMGVSMAPGFDLVDYTIGIRQDLIEDYPEHQALIELLTK